MFDEFDDTEAQGVLEKEESEEDEDAPKQMGIGKVRCLPSQYVGMFEYLHLATQSTDIMQAGRLFFLINQFVLSTVLTLKGTW